MAPSATGPPAASRPAHEAATPVHAYLYQMVEMGITRLFMEKHIFDEIPDDGITIADLASKTACQFNMMERFANFLIASGVFESPTPGFISHTPTSKLFQEKRLQLLYPHIYDCFLFGAVNWSAFFDKHGMQEPQKSNRSPFGLGFGYPDKTLYEIFDLLPERATAFNATMALGLGEMPILGVYDFNWIGEYAKRPEAKGRTLFVDIGGGMGQATLAILEENPAIPPAQCVLEDRASVIKDAEAVTGTLEAVKKVPISLFEEQPVKGQYGVRVAYFLKDTNVLIEALVYYIRRVLNDWPDAEVVQVLSHVRNACAPDSRLLISENLLPDQPSLNLAAADIWLMNFGGKRRNERIFTEVAERAGFKVSSIAKDAKTNSAVLELLPV